VSEGSKTSWGERKRGICEVLHLSKTIELGNLGVGEKSVPFEEVAGIGARYRTSGESVFTQLKNY
jgi:hypothetical protein